jgi:hypothetical protein
MGSRAVLVLLVVSQLAGCAADMARPPRNSPWLLLSDSEPMLVPRSEIGRYRCASGAILQCGGPSDQTAACVCSPPPWPAP